MSYTSDNIKYEHLVITSLIVIKSMNLTPSISLKELKLYKGLISKELKVRKRRVSFFLTKQDKTLFENKYNKIIATYNQGKETTYTLKSGITELEINNLYKTLEQELAPDLLYLLTKEEIVSKSKDKTLVLKRTYRN